MNDNDSQNNKKKKVNFKLISKIAGYVLVAVSFVFIIYSLRKLNFSKLQENFKLYWIPVILICIAVYPAVVVFFSIAWKRFLEFLSNIKLKYSLVISIYLKANIAKYIPGNVFHFAGRHYLVDKKGISHKNLLLSTGLEIFSLLFVSSILILTGIITGKITILNEVVLTVKEKLSGSFKIILFGIILLIFIITGIMIFLLIKKKKININRLIESIKQILTVKGLFVFLSNIIYYVLNFFIIGTILYIVVYLVHNLSFNINDYLFVMFTFSLAWVLGFIVPGAPGGAGIRESILIIMLGFQFSETTAVLAPILLRIITVLGDVMAFVLANVISFINKDIEV